MVLSVRGFVFISGEKHQYLKIVLGTNPQFSIIIAIIGQSLHRNISGNQTTMVETQSTTGIRQWLGSHPSTGTFSSQVPELSSLQNTYVYLYFTIILLLR